MARQVSVPIAWWKDQRRFKLAIKLGSRDAADGAMLNAWHVAEQFFIPPKGSKAPPKRGIPWSEWLSEDLSGALLEVGLATMETAEVRVAYIEEVWGWWYAKSFGGTKSAEVREERYGTSKPAPRSILEESSTVPSNTDQENEKSALKNVNLSASSASLNTTSLSSQNSNTAREIQSIVQRITKSVPEGGTKALKVLDFSGFAFRRHTSRFNELPVGIRGKPHQEGWNRSWVTVDAGSAALKMEPELGSHNIYCQHSSIKADENIPNRESCPEEDPHRLDMPEAEAIEYLRSWPLPKREDFQLRITWYHLERWCSRWAGAKLAFQNPQTRRARQINESQAARELRDQVVGSRHWTSVEIAAAKRDVERNGMIGSCAWEDPPEGVYRYLVDHMPAVLSRLERQSGERARRARGAAEGRRARQAARFNLKVRAFTAAYPDRPGRRKEIDRIRETYPVIFREIPRAGIEELAVAAALWNGSEVRCVRR